MTQKDFILLQKNLASWQKSGKKKFEELKKKFRETKEKAEKKDISTQIKELKQSYIKARSIEVFANNLANKLNLNPRSRLELPNTRFIVLDEEKKLLGDMSIGLDIQKSGQK
ncbi:TPA: hypothetical protein DEG21_03800 [Patescibacteria group bacterium]|nr:hypothetical protein [Candidatus Gracilibacteria bacterium]HBY74974.1 hypothetical protein [Candidatus Gracilibacteria bacterium]